MNTYSPWQIKKFAAKLKDLVCLLIGCTREQLENHAFKNKPLPEDWHKYGIIRRDGSRIIEMHGTREEAEARLSVWGAGAHIEEIKLTPRLLLQLIGTEAGREIIHPNIWVNSLFADYKATIHRIDVPARTCGFLDINVYPNWIITDMRFGNEKRAIEERGGITIQIERKTEFRYPELWTAYAESNEESWDDFLKNKGLYDNVYHPSETSLDNEIVWDYQIINNGTLEELIEEVRSILVDAKILKNAGETGA